MYTRPSYSQVSSAYDRQIEEFAAQNKANKTGVYVNGLLPEQKLKPVISIVLYYGTGKIPDSICAMMDIPKDECVRKYVQNYKLNMINLRELTVAQAELFRSDFMFIAKFLAKSYNKEEHIRDLRQSRQILVHTKDTLFTLAAITKDKRYLRLSKTKKEDTAVCEIADALYNEGFAEGVSKGIKSMIELCREMGLDRDNTFEKVAEKYHLSECEISDYMDKYWC